jgi:hypothetical protein
VFLSRKDDQEDIHNDEQRSHQALPNNHATTVVSLQRGPVHSAPLHPRGSRRYHDLRRQVRQTPSCLGGGQRPKLTWPEQFHVARTWRSPLPNGQNPGFSRGRISPFRSSCRQVPNPGQGVLARSQRRASEPFFGHHPPAQLQKSHDQQPEHKNENDQNNYMYPTRGKTGRNAFIRPPHHHMALLGGSVTKRLFHDKS